MNTRKEEIMSKKTTITAKQAIIIMCTKGYGKVTKQTIYTWIIEGIICGKKVGGRWHINKQKFLDYLSDRKI